MSDLLAMVRLAEALAWLHSYPPPDHGPLLERLGTNREAVAEGLAIWPKRMASALERGELRPTLAFADAYRRTLARASTRHPPIARVRLDPTLHEPDWASPAEPTRAAKAVETGGPYILPQHRAESRVAATVDPDATQVPPPDGVPVSLPFAQRGEPVIPPRVPVPPRQDTGTEAFDNDEPLGETGLTHQELLDFTLERYASTFHRLAMGEPRATVLAAQRLSETKWIALAQAWSTRLQQDQKLRDAFQTVMTRLRQG